jgi:hypothetical protein
MTKTQAKPETTSIEKAVTTRLSRHTLETISRVTIVQSSGVPPGVAVRISDGVLEGQIAFRVATRTILGWATALASAVAVLFKLIERLLEQTK